MLGDGLDIFFVEEGIIDWGEFAVGRVGGALGDFGRGEPGMDETGPERPSAERTFGDPGRTRGQAVPWFRV